MAIKDVLKTVIPTLRIVQISLASLDANDSGLDDAAAQNLLAGINAVQAYLDSFPQGTSVARGYDQIKAYCDNVTNSITLVIASSDTKDSKIRQVSDLSASLADNTRIYPAKNGADAQYLAQAIATAKAQLDALKATAKEKDESVKSDKK